MSQQERNKRFYDRHREEELERARRYREENPEKAKAGRRDSYHRCKRRNPQQYREGQIRRYGLSLEQYNKMLSNQDGVCAICKMPDNRKRKDSRLFELCIDHDHVTGAVRGLLCARCNSMLGWYEQYHLKASEYLSANWIQTGL